jgi:hypothetical protein
MGDEKSNTTPEKTNKELVVVMDGYGGDWTPSAIITSITEANKLKNMLSDDAQAVCSTPPWYETTTDAKERSPTTPPTNLPDELIVCFDQDTALGISDKNPPIREIQSKEGGLRTTVSVFNTAKKVADEKPVVKGQFIEATNTTATDLV